MGRKTLIRHPDASIVAMTHGFDGGWFLTETRDQEDKLRRMRRDVRGNITSVRELCGGRWNATSYIYTPLGEIATIIDDGGNATQVRYDSLGRRTAIDNPDAGLVEYLYDRAGNVTRKITPNLRAAGKSIRYYHSFTRLDRIDYPDMADTVYTYGTPGAPYNRAGRVAAVDNGSVKEERFYGRLGEVTRSVRTVKVTKPSPATKSVSMSYAYNNLGQMENVTFPDGETIIYAYDYGGRLLAVSGSKGGVFERYVRDIAYDEFGSRTRLRYGNDAVSEYEYDPLMRRLTGLVTTAGGRTVQNLEYEYDRAGNILSKTNRGFISAGGAEATSEQTYGYDDLHRLISSEGEYRDPKGVNTYTNDFTYDTIGNILTKEQVNDFDPTDGPAAPVPGTTYSYHYTYGAKPHAVVSTGDTTYTYDASGNMTAMKGPAIDRTISWDEENRVTKTLDRRDETLYAYDDGGIRAIKRGKYGETFYAGENLSIRNGVIESKHIFAGNTRVATTMKAPGADESVYYYHGDHLGSSSVVTSGAGAFHEGLEYFPYGETWVHASASPGNHSMPYRFTGKEQDPETGLYYFGARYYDARLSKWISTDPALGKYLPGAGKGNDDLPGMGGVFNPVNMSVYHYGGNNPLVYIDPDGKKIYLVHRELNLNPKKVTDSQKEASVRSTRRIAAHAFIATSIDGNKVDYVASWNGRGINDISQWNQSQDFIDMETDVAGYALIAGKATALTSDDVLDPYIAKAEMMLIQDGSPSFHKFGRWSTCQEESARLLITAMQVYEEETGKTYKGLTERGIESVNFNQHYRLSDHEFNELYYKVQDPANY